MPVTDDKVRENRVRRWAKRLGIELRRSRAKLVHVNNKAGYSLIHPDSNALIAGPSYDLSLDGVEAHLADYERKIVAERRT